jgi:hypothetical protein
MIRNEREYQTALKRLTEELERMKKAATNLKKKGFSLAQIKELQAPVKSFNEQLKEEVHEYEKLMRGDIASYHTFTNIGKMLIALRVSKRISQKELAKRLKVTEAQVSRDERNEYFGATTKKLDGVLEALDGHVEIRLVQDENPIAV